MIKTIIKNESTVARNCAWASKRGIFIEAGKSVQVDYEPWSAAKSKAAQTQLVRDISAGIFSLQFITSINVIHCDSPLSVDAKIKKDTETNKEVEDVEDVKEKEDLTETEKKQQIVSENGFVEGTIEEITPKAEVIIDGTDLEQPPETVKLETLFEGSEVEKEKEEKKAEPKVDTVDTKEEAKLKIKAEALKRSEAAKKAAATRKANAKK